MSGTGFVYPPSPFILQWLAAGQLASKLQRSLRLWVLLTLLYGSESDWRTSLPQPFSYPDLRDRLFNPRHPKSDRLNADESKCRDYTCICHKPFADWVFSGDTHQTEPQWLGEMMHLTGLSATELNDQLQLCPFTTVHRSLRDDLKQLCELGWLKLLRRGEYKSLSIKELPAPPVAGTSQPTFAQLSVPQAWELLRVLESVAFVQPNLELITRSLWEQLVATPTRGLQITEPEQRIFIHFDYILSEEMQDRVDTYQEQIEHLWRNPPGAVVQFEYWFQEQNQVKVTVYPVCLHYSRRAKYLSAFGVDPNGNIAWHNYRLDRIASSKLTVLAWGDPNVPKILKTMWRTGNLPTPAQIDTELKSAWGFNFYFPRDLLIIRFPPEFARWYVDNTERHPTFKSIAYKKHQL